MITRREALKGAAAISAAPALGGGTHSAGASQPAGKSVVGGFSVDAFPYMNFFKQTQSMSSPTATWPGTLSNDGYPTSTPRNSIIAVIPLPVEYFGRYRIQFSGQGSIQISPPTIVYRGGTYVRGIETSNAGSVAYNFSIVGQTNPSVEFAFGALISAVSHNGFGAVRLTSTLSNAFIGVPSGSIVQVNNVANLSGQWTISVVSNSQIDLVGSTYSSSMVRGTGGPGTHAEVILSQNQVTFFFLNTGTYASMSNAIFCRKPDIDGTNPYGLQNGYQCNADLISLLKQLNPKYLRLMDESAAIGSTATNYNYRPLVSNFACGAGAWYNDYWAGGPGASGAITNSGSDVYTCLSPNASPASGPYQDGEIVQGQIIGSNTTTNPVLNVNNRGNAPLYDAFVTLQNMTIAGSPTTGDVISITFIGSYLSGGSYTFAYTVQSTDTSLQALGTSITSAINANTTLSNVGIYCNNGGNGKCSILYNVNVGSGTSFGYSVSGAATETITFGRYAVGALTDNSLTTFTYSAVLGGWIQAYNTSLNSGMPTEVMCELCNRANIGLWINIPILYTNTSVYNFVAKVASLLNPNLPLHIEVSNEVWNNAEFQTYHAASLGLALGFPYWSNQAVYSFYALRVRQFMEQAANAWTVAGRARSLLDCGMSCWAADHGSNSSQYRMAGVDLSSSNLTYMAKGGPGATAAKDYTAVGNRPIDYCDSVSWANYWYGACFGGGTSNWSGSISNFAPALQAGANYASGSPSLMASAITAVYKDVYDGSLAKGGARDQVMTAQISIAAHWYTIVSSFDSARAGFGKVPLNIVNYEGGQQIIFSAGGNYTTSPADLAAQFASNGWDTSAYGSSNMVVAQQLINLWFAFMNSPNGIYRAVTALYTGIVAQNPGRSVSPAQYELDGPGIWATFPGDIYTTPFQSFNAIAAWNA